MCVSYEKTAVYLSRSGKGKYPEQNGSTLDSYVGNSLKEGRSFEKRIMDDTKR
jgi:hypothetical protein